MSTLPFSFFFNINPDFFYFEFFLSFYKSRFSFSLFPFIVAAHKFEDNHFDKGANQSGWISTKQCGPADMGSRPINLAPHGACKRDPNGWIDLDRNVYSSPSRSQFLWDIWQRINQIISSLLQRLCMSKWPHSRDGHFNQSPGRCSLWS